MIAPPRALRCEPDDDVPLLLCDVGPRMRLRNSRCGLRSWWPLHVRLPLLVEFATGTSGLMSNPLGTRLMSLRVADTNFEEVVDEHASAGVDVVRLIHVVENLRAGLEMETSLRSWRGCRSHARRPVH